VVLIERISPRLGRFTIRNVLRKIEAELAGEGEK